MTKYNPFNVNMTREGSMIVFSVRDSFTIEKATKVQTDLGYHPLGYGFYSYKCENGITTWKCSNSCD